MYKVLIVEDMDLTREDLISLIDWERYGFELLPDARNGKIGLEYAKRYRPDIVITDIKMPVMTGLDLVEQMKKENIEAEVILLTAYEEFELAKRALQMGVRTFILKYEIDEEVLLRELNGCIEALKTKENVSEIREFITKVQSLFSSQMGLSMTASIGGMIRKNKDILPAKEEAERIMKGRVFHRGVCILNRAAKDEKEEFSAEIKDALRRVEDNIEKDSYENMPGFLENVLCRSVRKTENLYIWRKVSEKLLYFLMHRCAALEQPEIEERLDRFKRDFQKMDIYSFMKEYEGIMEMLESSSDSRYSGKVRYIKAFMEETCGDLYSFEADITFGEGTRSFGIRVLEKEETAQSYQFIFPVGENRYVFEKNPNCPWFGCMNIGLERPITLRAGETYHVRMILDDTIVTLYVNGVALNSRVYEKPGDALSIFVTDGTIEVSNISIARGLECV